MSNMIERVAQAIYLELGYDPHGPTMDVYIPDDPVAHLPWAGFRHVARAAIAAMSEWQPIETAPKDGTLILAWHRYMGPAIIYWGCIQAHSPIFFWIPASCKILHWLSDAEAPSHWMPLPEQPK